MKGHNWSMVPEMKQALNRKMMEVYHIDTPLQSILSSASETSPFNIPVFVVFREI